MKTCKICGGKHLAKGLCSKHYQQLPEVKAKLREYYQKPEYKARRREYYQKPEYKAKQREYQRKPENREKKREYNRKYYQKPEVKARWRKYMREYHQKPEYKARRREQAELKKTITEYHTLLEKKKPSRTEILRLEALADILGRDIEEWRTERMRKDYHERMDFSQRFEKRSGQP